MSQRLRAASVRAACDADAARGNGAGAAAAIQAPGESEDGQGHHQEERAGHGVLLSLSALKVKSLEPHVAGAQG